ncbi:Chemotaxis protein CheY [Candidatus Lokiarchaeum ossiferum]|uniref:Chemotaxis protein CheY n=1 Tax=Candidatus Lokiarchaeum ossiferum TaxID=2951803 RepID=A0ABY6HZ43_9ARCH|nr:Chemotaxis protein CheY [Candidatus Lokiarchaeum sp. B-35]
MKTVVIVDDAEFMRKVVGKILKELQMEIVGEGETGDEGIALYKSHHPDLITMDLTMPNKSGLEAIEEIMKFDPKAKILVVSSIGSDLIIMQAMDLGAKDFVVKPFKKEQLCKAVQNIIDLN